MSASTRESRILHRFVQAVAGVSLLFFAGMLHLHEVPAYRDWWSVCIWGSVLLYPIFSLEVLVLFFRGQPAWKSHLLYLILPPLRLMAPHPVTGEIWLPRRGWVEANQELGDEIQSAFALPMIFIAILILPVIAVEHFFESQIKENSTYHLLVNLATCLIWLSFTVEFVAVMSLQNKKLRYCRQHWLDLTIIILPVIAFLRAARLARLARLKQISKTARIYRMRGVIFKFQRAIMMVSFVKRLLHSRPEARLKSLQEKLHEKEQEIAAIHEEIEELQRIIERNNEEQSLASESESA
jgi:hypothetical protein